MDIEYECKQLYTYLKTVTWSIILRIQHTNDPAWGYTTIAEGVWRLSAAFICKEISGDTHDYPEVKILKQVILDTNAK